MYKNCYVQRGEEWNHYRIHLWTDEGYSVEDYQNYGYTECSDSAATHIGLKGENLKRVFNWDSSTIRTLCITIVLVIFYRITLISP
jgi:hypothetical protein